MRTNQILDILKVVAWIVFIGLCIKTGALLTSFVVSVFVSPMAAADLYMGLDLAELFIFNRWHYISMALLTIIISGLKAYLFFWVIRITGRINFTNPFSDHVAGLILKISGISFQIGLTAIITQAYAKSLDKKQLHFSYEAGGAEFLILAGILYVIFAIFKRGIELQKENELTI